MTGRRKPYKRKSDYVPQTERAYGIRVVHRDRPDMTALTELFVRFTLAEANARRADTPPPVIVRPEVLKPGTDQEFRAKEGTITTRREPPVR